jgi:DNA polymerase elongation subunit (family B)
MLDIEHNGNKVHISYFDSDGNNRLLSYTLSPNEQYDWAYASQNDKNRIKGYLSWDGRPVKKREVKQTFSKFRLFEFLENLSDQDKEAIYAMNYPKMYFVDIEVGVSDEGFPHAEKAEQPVTTIALCNQKGHIFVLGLKPLNEDEISDIQKNINEHINNNSAGINKEWKLKYLYFENEKNMLYAFTHKFVKKMPCLTGWNFVEFDWQYLVNRCKKFDIDLASEASPTNTWHGWRKQPNHRLVFDYMEVYQKWDKKIKVKESGSLDWVANAALGINKVKYSGTLPELYEKDYKWYIFYNAIDACFVEMIDEKLNTFSTFLSLTNASKVPQLQTFSSNYIAERLLFSEYYQQKRILLKDPNKKKEDVSAGYGGAYVKEPKLGIRHNIFSMDFTSMYPSIMLQYNIGVDTYLGKLETPDSTEFYNEQTGNWEEFNPEKHLLTAFLENDNSEKVLNNNSQYTGGAVFSKENNSTLSNFVGKLFDKRYSYKRGAGEIENEIQKLEKMLNDKS